MFNIKYALIDSSVPGGSVGARPVEAFKSVTIILPSTGFG